MNTRSDTSARRNAILRLMIAAIFVVAALVSTSAQSFTCTNYIYLADQQAGAAGLDTIGKYRIESNGSLTKIGAPWFVLPSSDFTMIEGITTDHNGFVYAGTNTFLGEIRRITCDSVLVPSGTFSLPESGYNLGTYGDYLFVNNVDIFGGGMGIVAYNLCTQTYVGEIGLTGMNSNAIGFLDWGFQVQPDGSLLINSGFSTADSNVVWYIQPTIQDFIDGTSFDATFTENDSDLSSGDLFGITTDNAFIYIVETSQVNQESTIHKYDFAGNSIATLSDVSNGDTGFFGAMGIVYSASVDRLYVTSQLADDCIAILDTSMAYLGVGLPPNTNGSGAQLTLATEGCPDSMITNIDSTLCNVAVGDSFFLQDLIPCGGPICEGAWTADGGNTGIVYSPCNFSFRIVDLDGCATFTLESDGTAPNAQCGAFTLTINFDFASVTGPVMSADQLVCTDEEPDTLFAAGASGSGALAYQWQISPTSCIGPFTDILAATDTFYVPGMLADTMYYRILTSSAGTCAYGACVDTSSCITIATAFPACNATTNGPVCSGDPMMLNENGGDAVTWNWGSFNGAVFNDNSLQSPTVTGVVDGETFMVTITDANGCTAICTTVASVRELPGCAATNNGPICMGDSLQLEETGGDAISWSWTSNMGATITSPNSMITNATGVTDGEVFTVTVTDADGCSSTCSTTAVVNALPSCGATNNGPICDGETLTLNENGGSATSWSWSSNGTAAFNNPGNQSPQATGVANGEIFTVTVTDINGCTSTCSTTAVVNANPSCAASNNGPICDGQTLTIMETGGSATMWSWSSNGGATITTPTASSSSVTDVSDGEIFTVTVTDANGCTSTCSTTATVNPNPDCAISDNGPICVGETFELQETGGAATGWSWSSNGGAVISNGTTASPSATSVSNGEIFTVIVTDANGCTSTCSATAVVNPAPSCSASNNGPICEGDTLVLNELGVTAVSWSWSSNISAQFSNPNVQSPLATGVANGEIFTVTVTDANGCTSTCSTTAVVNANPTCAASNDGPICEGQTLTIMETGGSATMWSWSSNGGATIATPAASSSTVTNVSDGEIFTVTITDANGCTSTCSTTATVNPNPDCAISDNGPICVGETFELQETGGAATGWSWSSNDGAIISNGSTASPSATGVSNGEIFTVVVTDANGCTSTCSATAVVNPAPSCSASNNGPICEGDTLVLNELGVTGVSWSWSSNIAAQFSNPNVQSPLATGVTNAEVFTVTVTDANGCTSTCSTTAVVNANPTCAASNNGPICDGQTLTIMETGGSATMWSWSSNGGATIATPAASSSSVTNVSDGEIFTVTITDANGCTSTCSTTATVNPNPDCAISDNGPICVGETFELQETGGAATGWSWSSNDGAIISNGSTASPSATGVSNGEIFTVVVTDANGCTSTCSATAVVNPAPSCSASNNGPICEGDTLVLNELGVTGVSWSWSSNISAQFSNPNVQSPLATGVTNAEVFTVTVTDANGCTSTCSTTAVVNANPTCAASNNGPICDGQTLTIMETGGSATMWSWSSNGGATIATPAASSSTVTNVSDGEIFTVTITDANGCTSTCSTTANVNPNPDCAISDNGPICVGETFELQETGGAATGWSWSSNDGAIISNGSTASPSATGVSNGEIFTVVVTDANGCTSTCSATAVVNPAPSCSASNNGPICEGDTLVLNELGVTGVSWSWSSNISAQFSNPNVQSPLATGVTNAEVFTVTVTDANGCTSTCSTTAVVNANPTCAASNNGPICDGQTLTIMETGGSATMWSWSSNGGATIATPAASSSTVTNVSDGEIFTVTITDANGCTSTCSTTATVNPNPDCAISDNGPICVGETFELQETGGAATGWSWSSNGGAVISNGTTASPSATGVSNGEIFTVVVTDANGCTSTCSATAIVNPAPSCSASNNGPICEGDTLVLNELGVTGVSWSWSSNISAQFSNPNVQSPLATGVTNAEVFTVTVTDANGCTSTCSTTAVVNANPTCAASNNGPICDGQTLTIMETGGSATMWSWSSNGGATIATPAASSSTVTNVSDGEIFTVTITDANGCTSICSTTAVVNSNPDCAASNNGPICAGETLQLQETGGAGTSWSWSSNMSAVISNGTTASPSATAVSNGEIFTVTVTDVNGCSSTCSTTAVVNPLPACDASNDGPICEGDILTLNETGGSATSWSWATNGPGLISDASAQSPTVSGAADSDIFTVTVTDANGCTSTCQTIVVVNALPACTIDGPTAVCEETMDVDYTGPAALLSYLWTVISGDASIDGASSGQMVTIDFGTMTSTLQLEVTDANGCASTCTLEVIVNADPICSINGPDSVCPQSQDVQYSGTGGMTTYLWTVTGGDAVIDGLDNSQSVVLDFGSASSTLQLEITDNNGCTSSCTFDITVEDLELPLFLNCPDTINVANDPSECNALVNWSIPVATDACDDTVTVTQTAGPTPGSSIDVNTPTLIRYQATDDSGNSAECTFVIIVSDTENPVASCRDTAIYLDNLGSAAIVAADIDGGSSDNCAIGSIAASQTAFSCADVGPNNVILTVTDVNGNISSCVAEVTVIDTLIPSFNCPADQNVSGCAGVVPDLISGLIGVDNCPGPVVFSQNPLAGVAFGPNADDTIAVVITATDDNGNTATCEVVLTILDDELPVFVNCPDSLQLCNDIDVCGATANWLAPVAVDNCDDTLATIQISGLPSGSLFPIGSTLITYTATDDDGNAVSCTFVVTVDDCQRPDAVCQEINVELDATGNAAIVAADIDGGSSDNCAIDTRVISQMAFDCDDVGLNLVTLLITDVAGNVDSCVASVNVLDLLAPDFACPADMSISGCSGTVPDLISGLVATDNCDDADVTFSQNPLPNVTFGPNANDTIAVIITATDANGNTTTCEVVLTIIDDELPVFVNCPSDVLACNDVDACEASVFWIAPIAVDNCDDTLTTVQTTGPTPGTAFPMGETLITYVATDDDGNSTTCTFRVIVSDCQNPSAICQDVTIELDGAGMGATTAAAIDGGSFDNCALDTLIANVPPVDCDDLGSFNVTLIAVDTAGNADSCVATITVVDLLAPQFTCPEDMTVSGCSGTIPDLVTGLTGTDNCDDGSIVFTQNPLPNVTFGPNANDTIGVIITATDASGNSSTCEVILTIVDDELPVFVNCPADFIVCNDIDECQAIVNWVAPVAVDNCDDTLATVQTTGPAPGTPFPLGESLITYVATDDDGNSTSCTFRVTVNDCQNPSAICQDFEVMLDASGMRSMMASVIDGGSFDNCTLDTIIASMLDFTCDDLGLNNVTLVVIDSVGNRDSCVATVTVVDLIPPQFTCPADLTVDGCSGTVPDLISGLVATDNCDDAAVTFTQNPLPNVTFGPNANDTIGVIITATDGSGNTSTCEVIVTIIDDELPVFVNCPADFNVCNDIDDCQAVVNWFPPVAVDNCDDTLTTIQTTGPAPGTPFPMGESLVTYVATDDEGNSTTCTFRVTVTDCQNPSAICQDVQIFLDADGMGSVPGSAIDGGSFDNCQLDTLISTIPAVTCDDIGVFNVTLIAIDTAGNADSCVATITVVDAIPPQFTCPVDLTVDGCSGTVPDLISGLTATDNCDDADVTFTQNPLPNVTFGPNANDTIGVIITATDASGNTSTCEVVITIIDDELPVFVNCPSDFVVCNDIDDCQAVVNWFPPVAVDNCDDTLTTVQTSGPAPGTPFPMGETLVTYVATDDEGNSMTCTFRVTVNDCQNPSAICQDVQIFLDADGMGSVPGTAIDGGSFDNCELDTLISSIPIVTCDDIGFFNVTLVAVDTAGNADSCVATITVIDAIPPQFTCPADLTVDGCSGTVPDLISGLTATDNCDDADVTFTQNPLPNVTFGPNANDTIGVIITATDASGNTSTCEVILTIIDDELPVFVNCPADFAVCNDIDACEAVVNWFPPVAVDNCDDTLSTVQTTGPAPGTPFPMGVTLVTYVATDDEGNSTTCTFRVTVSDCQNPSAICQDVQIFLDADGMGSVPGLAIDGGSFDNCQLDTLISSVPVVTCDDIGFFNVTLIAVDTAGNADSCVATIFVLDTIAPEFECPADLTLSGCSGTVPDLISGLTATDNCDDDDVTFTQNPLPNVTFGPNANDTIGVIITATDASGNTSTCEVVLTIIDNEDPVFVNCPDTISVANDPNVCGTQVNWFIPVAVDNCDDTMQVVQTQGLAPGSVFPVGLTQIEYIATDDEGNAVNCTFVVIVSDTENPEASCQDIFVYVDENCEFTIGADEIDGGSTDNCAIDTLLISRDGGMNFSDSVTFTMADLADPFVQVILLVTDSSGNTSQCVATVTVIDAQDPMVICQADITVSTEPGHCHGIIPNIIPPFDTTDNCAPVVNLDQFPEAGLLFGTAHGDSLEVFLIATDIDGNMDTCSLFVFLEDTEAPTFLNCPRPPIVQKAMPGVCGAFVNFSPPIADDNCEVDTVLQVDGSGLMTGDMFPVGVTILRYIAIDVAGNISDTCEYKIIVNDGQPPTIECPDDVVTNNDPSECGAVINDISAIVTDNCPDNLAVIFEIQDIFGNIIECGVEDASGTFFPVGINNVIYSVQDQPVVLITEVTQSGADMIEITNFGPASVNLSCLTIERLGAGDEAFTISGDQILAPGEVYVYAFVADILESDGAEYQISLNGTVLDVVATNGYAASIQWNGILDGGDVYRALICDHDLASDWVVASACDASSIGFLNPGLPTFADNGAVVGLQSQLPNIEQCSFSVIVNDIELPYCAELNLQLYETNDIPVGFSDGDCVTSIITVNDNFEVGQLNVLDLIGTTSGGTDGLTVLLTSPEGTTIQLFSGLCGAFNGFDLGLSDTSLVHVNAASCGPLGLGFSYMPQESLLNFCGENVAGDWTLSVQSDGTSGTLQSWSLQFLEQLPWAMNDTVLNNDPGQCGGVFTWTHAAFGDNCCEGMIRVDYESDDAASVPTGGIIFGGEEVTEFFEVGTTTVIYTLTDQAGNTSQCEFDVTVLDAELPEIVCPPSFVIDLDPGACAAPANFLPDFAADNCGIIDTISESGAYFDIGNHIVTIIVTDAAGNTAECTLNLNVLEFLPSDGDLTCNNSVQVSLDQNCEAQIGADMILEGDNYRCYENYCIYIIDVDGDTVPNALLTLDHVDQCFTVSVVDCLGGGNSCWGEICVEEKIAPEIACPPDTVVACNQSTDVAITGEPEILSCEGVTVVTYVDDVTNFGECSDPRVRIIRTWTVLDASGNSSTCEQVIEVRAYDANEISWPSDFVDANAFTCNAVLANPSLTEPSNTGLPMINGESIFGDHYCEIRVATWDKIFQDANCSGSYTILRHWEILNDCEPLMPGINPVDYIQVIEVNDEIPPVISCISDITISADPWFCVASIPLELPDADDVCSDVANYSVQVSGGSLLNFGNNNYVLANLEVGVYTVTFKINDDCKNEAECSYTITVEDDIPPVPLCDEHTVVSLIEDANLEYGLTKVPATVFDDGSYDNCGPVTFEARRIISCIDFDWTTAGAGVDEIPNGIVNSADRGQIFTEYVPFSCCDAEIGSGNRAPVMVELRVTDIYGNTNTCMVEVEVQDKLRPYIECPPDVVVSCDFWFNAQETNGFVDQELDELSNLFGRVLDAASYDESDRQPIVIDDPGRPSNPGHPDYLPQPYQWGIDGWADDNCDVDIEVRVRIFDDCSGDGLPGVPPHPYATRLVERTFRAQDGQGNSGTCVQRIWVANFDPFYINANNPNDPTDDVGWPADVTYTTCPGEIPVDYPVILNDGCSTIGIEFEDQVFEFVDGACRKILRTWTVIDWCQYDVSSGEGLWSYLQIIKVNDQQPALFVDCPGAPEVLCVADDNVYLPNTNQVFVGEESPSASSCSAHVNLTRVVTETCSDVLIYDVKLFLNDGVDFVQVVSSREVQVDSLDSAILTFESEFASLPSNHPIRRNGIPYNDPYCSNWPAAGGEKDYHRILWTVEDGCGNLSTCEYLFRLEDCKKPTPVCTGLSSVVMPSTGEVTIWAQDFNASSVDDCTQAKDLLFSFSGDTYMPSMSFNCETIVANGSPTFIIEIWVADGGNDQNCNGSVLPLGIEWSERNKDFCTTYIHIDDNEGVCPGTGSVGGMVMTEEDEPVESVTVHLTDPSGLIMQTYETNANGAFHFINPLLTYSIDAERNDDHMNGVSTLDLVRIQKHLLGLQPFTSPYKMIAADANNSESVSAIDLVEIRKLILGVNLEFPNNQSWRFVDSDFNFVDVTHPWPFDEVIELESLNIEENFVAVKIGDVNGTVTANVNQIETRNTTGALRLEIENRDVVAGERIEVPVRSSNFQDVLGYQFTLHTDGLEFADVQSGDIDVSRANFGMHSNAVTTSWHKAAPVSSDGVLFTLYFQADRNGPLRDMLKISSRLTRAEAYTVEEEVQDLELTFVSKPVAGLEGLEFALFQNTPNPVKDLTTIAFILPQMGDAVKEIAWKVQMTFYDEQGRTVRVIQEDLPAGKQSIDVSRNALTASGILYYRLEAVSIEKGSDRFTATKKMILIN